MYQLDIKIIIRIPTDNSMAKTDLLKKIKCQYYIQFVSVESSVNDYIYSHDKELRW